jgi:HAD superfamily hydrolase (TIGR01509 family)
MIKGILFDMDGVLVDSEEFICEAAIKMFSELCIWVEPEDFKPFVGMGENRYLGGVAEKYGYELDVELAKVRTYTIYGDLVKGKLKTLNGVKQFVTFCREKGLKMAVASSADRMKVDINLKEMGFSDTTFDAIITGSDVINKKPNPEIFVKSSEKIGLKPENCLVVEDAINGIQAGKAAGCKCLALTTSFNAEQLKDADWICKDLSDVPEDLIKLLWHTDKTDIA